MNIKRKRVRSGAGAKIIEHKDMEDQNVLERERERERERRKEGERSFRILAADKLYPPSKRLSRT